MHGTNPPMRRRIKVPLPNSGVTCLVFWWNKSQSCGPIVEQATHLCNPPHSIIWSRRWPLSTYCWQRLSPINSSSGSRTRWYPRQTLVTPNQRGRYPWERSSSSRDFSYLVHNSRLANLISGDTIPARLDRWRILFYSMVRSTKHSFPSLQMDTVSVLWIYTIIRDYTSGNFSVRSCWD